MKIGILGLQGAFFKHQQMLNSLDCENFIVRYPEEINQCNALILPGGESTTITKLIDRIGMRQQLINFNGPIFGTCAGAILLSETCDDERVKVFGKIPVNGFRNAYGRQIESFKKEIKLSFSDKKFPAIFIRAPKFSLINSEIEVLSEFENIPVLLKYKNILISAFHPELTKDLRIHKYFIELVEKS